MLICEVCHNREIPVAPEAALDQYWEPLHHDKVQLNLKVVTVTEHVPGGKALPVTAPMSLPPMKGT